MSSLMRNILVTPQSINGINSVTELICIFDVKDVSIHDTNSLNKIIPVFEENDKPFIQINNYGVVNNKNNTNFTLQKNLTRNIHFNCYSNAIRCNGKVYVKTQSDTQFQETNFLKHNKKYKKIKNQRKVVRRKDVSKFYSWLAYLKRILFGPGSQPQVDVSLSFPCIFPEDGRERNYKNVANIPKPTLSPSNNHYSRAPAERVALFNRARDSMKLKCVMRGGFCGPQPELSTKKLKVEEFHNQMSKFLVEIRDLCDASHQQKDHSSITKPFFIPNKKRKPCNALISNEEFKNRPKGQVMPDRYVCGAGKIEKEIFEARQRKRIKDRKEREAIKT